MATVQGGADVRSHKCLPLQMCRAYNFPWEFLGKNGVHEILTFSKRQLPIQKAFTPYHHRVLILQMVHRNIACL